MAEKDKNNHRKTKSESHRNEHAKPAHAGHGERSADHHAEHGHLAIVLVRGTIHAKKDIVATMDNFMLRQRLSCVVVTNGLKNRKAALKCKDYVTFGEISEETYKHLVSKRGEKDADGKAKRHFRLHPPRGGFEKGGIKKPFSMGGALGDRKGKMDDLVKRMI